MNKRIEELTQEDIIKSDNFKLVNIKERASQLFDKWKWNLPIEPSAFFKTYEIINKEIKKRNIRGLDKKIDDVVFKKDLFGLNVFELPIISVINDFVLAVGEFAEKGKNSESDKIRILIRGNPETDKNPEIEKLITDSIQNQTGKEVEFFYKEIEINKVGLAIPLYRLNLVPVFEMRKINIDKKNELSLDDKWTIIHSAIRKEYGERAHVYQIYDDYLIVNIYNAVNGENDLLKVPYKIDVKDREAKLSVNEAVEVRMEYIESKSDEEIETEYGELIKTDEVFKPYPNEHSARLKEPAGFNKETFRRKKNGTIYGNKKIPTTVSVIWGKLKGKDAPEDMPIPQALRFPKDVWTESKAKNWLKKHKIKYVKFEPAEKKEAAELPITLQKIDAEFIYFEKKEDEEVVEHFVHAIVYEPDELDTQEDKATAEEIEKGAHWYLENSGQLRIMHGATAIEKDKAALVESFIAPEIFKRGTETIKKGTWCVVIKIKDKELWGHIENGDITGISLGGVAQAED